ncbi:hypothetical protein RHECNPAF_280075 [Rhizobium etli CNPAF512]|nr:hypothetical protein RHECNPAF_280075 [Rhizobium etli CNPAF512]
MAGSSSFSRVDEPDRLEATASACRLRCRFCVRARLSASGHQERSRGLRCPRAAIRIGTFRAARTSLRRAETALVTKAKAMRTATAEFMKI